MLTGIIFDIKRFAVHDGPGIRTTVFLKGCPLKCVWCHNPESIDPQPCILERVSRIGDLSFADNETVGQVKTVQEVMDVLEKERVFMEESGGGVTFSGGEPMLQHEFLLELLKACKTVGLHTTVDTSGFAAPSFLRKIIPFTDLFLYDLKLMDSEKHRFYTGIPNKIILENLQGLSSLNSKIRIRIPIIHDINDNDENTNQTIGFLKNLLNPVEGIDLLPFHNTANGKYKRFEINYTMNENKKPDDLVMNKLKQQFEDAGLEVKIGG